jgi:hypothetical protein
VCFIVCERPKRKQPSWFSASTLKLIDAQDKAKKIHLKRPTPDSKYYWRELQKRVTTSFKLDEGAHLNAQITDLESAASKRDHGTVWQIIDHKTSSPKNPV